MVGHSAAAVDRVFLPPFSRVYGMAAPATVPARIVGAEELQCRIAALENGLRAVSRLRSWDMDLKLPVLKALSGARGMGVLFFAKRFRCEKSISSLRDRLHAPPTLVASSAGSRHA